MLEIFVLVVLSLAAAGFISTKSTEVREEFSGFHCLTANAEVPRIIIANFDPADESGFSQRLGNYLGIYSRDRLQICRYNHQIKAPIEVDEIGKEKLATIVVWGDLRGESADIYLNAIGRETLFGHEPTIPVMNGQADVALLAEMLVADNLYLQGEFSPAQTNLMVAIEVAERENLANSNPQLLARSYFILGQLYDPALTYDNLHADSRQALFAYSKAIDYNSKLHQAYLNRAMLYWYENQVEKVLADLNVLINAPSVFIDYAYWLRGQLYLEQGQYSEAISDLNIALQYPTTDYSNDPDLIYALGKAYLLNGDYTQAVQTYQDLFPPLTLDDVNYYVNDLKEILNDDHPPEVIAGIEEIIQVIQQMQSP
jgi:tetratricopeptide (TPR) repeat protein